MAPLTLTFLAISCFLTAIISAVTGMGGGVLLLSLMTLVIPLETTIPLHGVIQLISNSSRTIILRKTVRWDFAIPYFLGLPLGTAFSLYLKTKITSPTIPLLLIVVIIFYALFKPKKMPPLMIPKKAFFFLGMTVGIFSLLIGAIGPLIAPFFLRKDLKKEEIIATKAIVQFAAHLLKIPAFLYLGFNFQEYLIPLIIAGLITILGTNTGIKILYKTSEKIFIHIYKTVLFLSALRIIYKILT